MAYVTRKKKLFKRQKNNNNNSSNDTLICFERVIITNPYFIYIALHIPDTSSWDSRRAPLEPVHVPIPQAAPF